jgi:hypothetical protein
LTPITPLAASRSPVPSVGAWVFADSMSARTTQSPLKMPDIRLQAHPLCHNYRSISSFVGGVHIGGVKRRFPSSESTHLTRASHSRPSSSPAPSTTPLAGLTGGHVSPFAASLHQPADRSDLLASVRESLNYTLRPRVLHPPTNSAARGLHEA